MYTCPMHPEIVQEKPGNCPVCGMKLVKKDAPSYTPLIVIMGLILLVSLVGSFPAFQVQRITANFMIGFFLVFSGFKLIDLLGFAQGYATYDLLAQKVPLYGYIYPFVELFFGLSMILFPISKPLLLAELTVMSFSGLGVAIKLIKKEKFQCVCLGTFLKVPLTKITLVEDFGMAILATLMLLIGTLS